MESIGKREAQLSYLGTKELPSSTKYFHLAWALIDPKSIEKVLPSLCELGVSKISFISTQRGQKNFKLEPKRIDRIIENAMQQSGRLNRLEYEMLESLDAFIKSYPDALVLDFCDTVLKKEEHFRTVLIGPEGGFSPKERELLGALNMRRLDTSHILRSETAALAISSLMLL